jgi:hypothetical protein
MPLRLLIAYDGSDAAADALRAAASLSRARTRAWTRKPDPRSPCGAILLTSWCRRWLGRLVLVEHVPAADVADVVTDRDQRLAPRARELGLILAPAFE